MNIKTFLAMLARDAQVYRRNLIPLLLQTFLQPLTRSMTDETGGPLTMTTLPLPLRCLAI